MKNGSFESQAELDQWSRDNYCSTHVHNMTTMIKLLAYVVMTFHDKSYMGHKKEECGFCVLARDAQRMVRSGRR